MGLLFLDDGEDLVFADDRVLLVVDLDVLTGVFADEHSVALLDGHRETLAVVVQLAVAD